MTQPRNNERSHYDALCAIFEVEIRSSLGSDWSICCVNNTGPSNLRDQVDQICSQLGLPPSGKLFPAILTDVVLGATNGDGKLRLAMIEVKGPAKSVGLVDYSQLVGYLQVARLIEVGALLLIEQGTLPSPVSGDLKKLINTDRLLVYWRISSTMFKEHQNFNTGICSYVPGGFIDWIDLKSMSGISSWIDLANAIKSSTPI
jgi:hypothetical protein